MLGLIFPFKFCKVLSCPRNGNENRRGENVKTLQDFPTINEIEQSAHGEDNGALVSSLGLLRGRAKKLRGLPPLTRHITATKVVMFKGRTISEG